jgi:copper chaperone
MQRLPSLETTFLQNTKNNLIPLGGILHLFHMERNVQDNLTLSIEGMHCGACVRRATTALQKVAGVRLDSVDVGSAKMSFNSEQATAGEIVGALDRIGFVAHIEK